MVRGGKALAAGGSDGGGGVLAAKRGGRLAGLLGAEDLFVQAAVGQDEKTEAVAQKNVALADPGIVIREGRVGEPVSGEGELLAQGWEQIVAGIVVGVEAEVVLWGWRAGLCRLRLWHRRRGGEQERGDGQTEEAHRVRCVRRRL